MNLKGWVAIAILVALFASLSLNFVGLGFFAARSMQHVDVPTRAERLVALGAPTLPQSLREIIDSELADDRRPLRLAYRDIQDARIALLATMRNDPVDEAAIRAAFANFRGKISVASSIGENAIIRALAQSPANVRAAITAPATPAK